MISDLNGYVVNHGLKTYDDPSCRSFYYYWIYGDDKSRRYFKKWCKDNMSDIDLTNRFNGGDPFLEVKIYQESDQVLFKLRWVTGPNKL